MTRQETERQEATGKLREWIKPGDTVYTILRHVSRSGMSRTVDALGIEIDGDDRRIYAYGWNVAKALGWTFDRDREGVKVRGCGMDMGFALVYALGAALFRDGFGCIGQGCPSNDHSNGDRDFTPHKPEGLKPQVHHWHNDGGYALKQRWL